MRRKSVTVMSQADLETLPTRVLLWRLQRLRECEESPERSDLDWHVPRAEARRAEKARRMRERGGSERRVVRGPRR
jgi:hypothetical protein